MRWIRSVTNLISVYQSGQMQRLTNLRDMRKQDSIRTVLWTRQSLIIWKVRLLKNENKIWYGDLLQSSLKKSKASPYRATENRRNRHLPVSSIFIYHILPFYKIQNCTIEIHQISCISFISYHKIQKKTREIARILQFCKRKCIFSWCDSGFTHI